MSESKKLTIDDEILARLQQLEVVVMEQRKEIDMLKTCDSENCGNKATIHLCRDCYGEL